MRSQPLYPGGQGLEELPGVDAVQEAVVELEAQVEDRALPLLAPAAPGRAGHESSGLAPRSFLKALTGNQGRQEKYTRLSGSQRQGVMKQRCASLAALPRRQKSARVVPRVHGDYAEELAARREVGEARDEPLHAVNFPAAYLIVEGVPRSPWPS